VNNISVYLHGADKFCFVIYQQFNISNNFIRQASLDFENHELHDVSQLSFNE